MEVNTTQKCSYMPVCPPPRETHPWAVKSSFSTPNIPVEKETTYKLSYPKNSGDKRSQMCFPLNHPKLITTNVSFAKDTIYKESYPYPNGVKPCPILPQPQLHLPCNAKMDCNSMYKMAYPRHCPTKRQKPIIPCPPSMLGEGPMQDLTTQKHDFVAKPNCKRAPIMPRDIMIKTSASLDKETTTRLSYMKPDMNRFCKTVSFKPITFYHKPEGEFIVFLFQLSQPNRYFFSFHFKKYSCNGRKYNTEM